MKTNFCWIENGSRSAAMIRSATVPAHVWSS